MPSLKDIRRRISSVKNTQKITRAMKLVAAAKLRRAQEAIQRQRPYAIKLQELIAELAMRADTEDHPLLQARPDRKVMLVALTSDRGLCGAFNTTIIRATEAYIQEHQDHHEQIDLAMVGKKGTDYFSYRNVQLANSWPGVDVNTAVDRADLISDQIIEAYLEQSLDKVYLIYNEFKSAMTQSIAVEQLLPIVPAAIAEDETPGDFAYEPDKRAVLDQALPMYVHVQLYRATLETTASELGARMTAMENATNNASEMLDGLTLEYNKARQAAITKELLEIVSGAEALK